MDLHIAVRDGFTRFKAVWQFDDFWKRGNTYHAYLRFVAAAEQRFPKDPVLKDMAALRWEMIGANTAYFRAQSPNAGWWADDYGWWGMALLASRDALNALGDREGAAAQLGLAQTAWKLLLAHGYDYSTGARPVPHGCANKPANEATGTKNTVTNANLFLLSVRLYAALAGSDPAAARPYLDMALAQASWFDAWLNGPHGYLRLLDKGTYGLVQERPIAEPDYMRKDHPLWQPGWLWSGDQGLVLAALAEFSLLPAQALEAPGQGHGAATSHRLNPAFPKILLGVRKLLFGPQDAILREAPFNSTFGDEFEGDYVAGRGILMRYLSEPSVRRVHGAPFAPEAVIATAAAVWSSRNQANGQFAADWAAGNNLQFNQHFRELWGYGEMNVSWAPNSAEGVRQAAGLDALSAAMLV